MKVGQRLFLAVVPAVLGLFLVAALAYWGQYTHTAPELVVLLAAVGVVASLIIVWRNTRYVAQRIERLAGQASRRAAMHDLGMRDVADAVSGGTMTRRADELDEIEANVAGLRDQVTMTREDSSRRERASEARAHEYERLLDAVATRFAQRMQEAQLPLHILLSSPFGELNENQEEMLGAAQTSLDAADTDVRQLRKLIDITHGSISFVRQPVGLGELLRPALAIAEAKADQAGVQLTSDISATAPRAIVDARHAQEALTSVLADAVARTAVGGDVRLDARESTGGRIRLIVTGGDAAADGASLGTEMTLDMLVASRLLASQGGSLAIDGGATVVELLAETPHHVTL